MEKKKISLPPRPDCGSIEINKMIDAVNRGEKVNPCPGSAERDQWWKNLWKDMDDAVAYAKENGYPPKIVFSYVEPDAYEEALKSAMFEDALPNGWMDTMLEEKNRERQEAEKARKAGEGAQHGQSERS